MTGQSDAAAERSAHVARTSAASATQDVLTEVAPGVFRLAAIVRAEEEAQAWRAEWEAAQDEIATLNALLSEARAEIAKLRDPPTGIEVRGG